MLHGSCCKVLQNEFQKWYILLQMLTNQKVLGILLIAFIIGAGIYFTISKFKQEISGVSASPTPTPATLDFLLTKSPAPANGQQQQQQAQPAELPLAKNKKLSKFPGPLKPADLANKKAMIQTVKGIIELQIYPEATMAASNFLILADNGYYNGLTFHRVEPGFVIQGGDPVGDGSGGPGYTFTESSLFYKKYDKGILAMAKRADEPTGTGGSQFFIMLADNPLPPEYVIFGKVIFGQDVVEKIAVGDVMQKVTVQNLQ